MLSVMGDGGCGGKLRCIPTTTRHDASTPTATAKAPIGHRFIRSGWTQAGSAK